MDLPTYSAPEKRTNKSVFLSEAEFQMLDFLTEATRCPSASDCLRLLIKHEYMDVTDGNRQRSEFISIRNRRMLKRQSYRLSKDEQQYLNLVCEFFGDNESAVIRHLVRYYYAVFKAMKDADNE